VVFTALSVPLLDRAGGANAYTSIVVTATHLRFCSERGRLLDLLAEAANRYAKLANELCAEISTSLPRAYQKKRSAVEHARNDAEHAREMLLTHRKEHRFSARYQHS